MSLFVIGDEDTVMALQLLGAQGKTVRDVTESKAALDEATANDANSLVLITRDVADGIREEVERLKTSSLRPLLMELPDRDGNPPVPELREMVRRSIGMGS